MSGQLACRCRECARALKAAQANPPTSELPLSFGVDASLLADFTWWNCTTCNSDHAFTLEQLPEAAHAMTQEAIGQGLPPDPKQGPAAEPDTPYSAMSLQSKLRYVCHVMKSSEWKTFVAPADGFHKKRNAEARQQPDYADKVEKWSKNPSHAHMIQKVLESLEMDWSLRAEHLEDLGVSELKKVVKAREDEEKGIRKRKRETAAEASKEQRQMTAQALGLPVMSAANWDGVLTEARIWYVVDVSKSDRSVCKKCQQKIPKKVPRVAVKGGQNHRPGCECEQCEAAREELR